MIKISIIGSNGFISKNFLFQRYLRKFKVIKINKKNFKNKINEIKDTDYLLHFAGTNRSKIKKDFKDSNVQLMHELTKVLEKKKNTKIIYISTKKINEKNLYGRTKKEGEKYLVDFCKKNNKTLYVYRPTNIFGKWSKPFYNSVVSTFCYSIINNIKYINHSPNKKINIVYVGDLIDSINKIVLQKRHPIKTNYINNFKVYSLSLQKLENIIISFKELRIKKNYDIFKSKLNKKLYSTYVSYFDKKNFFYNTPDHADSRGKFIEFIKSKSLGQVSFFTIKPSQTRGCHYHHYKTEKFLITDGEFEVKYQDISDKKKKFKKKFDKQKSFILETMPGYYHEIKNVGKHNLSVLIWSNEVYNPLKHDTYKLENEKI